MGKANGAVRLKLAPECHERGCEPMVAARWSSTEYPGLAITPAHHHPALAGGLRWSITHTASGLAIGVCYFRTLKAAHQAAVNLGRLNIDWTLPQRRVHRAIRNHRELITDVMHSARATEMAGTKP